MNQNQPQKKHSITDSIWFLWGVIIFIFGFFFLLGYAEHKESIKECDVKGCSNTCKKGEKYCKDHRHYDLYQEEKSNALRRKIEREYSKKEKSNSKSYGGSYYSGDIYGAQKYNNPDDFADDWEDDFDSWDDAYDYWEDVMD